MKWKTERCTDGWLYVVAVFDDGLHLQLPHELDQLVGLSVLVLLDDGTQVLRELLLPLHPLVQVQLRLNELTLRTQVALPATTNKDRLQGIRTMNLIKHSKDGKIKFVQG